MGLNSASCSVAPQSFMGLGNVTILHPDQRFWVPGRFCNVTDLFSSLSGHKHLVTVSPSVYISAPLRPEISFVPSVLWFNNPSNVWVWIHLYFFIIHSLCHPHVVVWQPRPPLLLPHRMLPLLSLEQKGIGPCLLSPPSLLSCLSLSSLCLLWCSNSRMLLKHSFNIPFLYCLCPLTWSES